MFQSLMLGADAQRCLSSELGDMGSKHGSSEHEQP